jgi:hypothetical protein
MYSVYLQYPAATEAQQHRQESGSSRPCNPPPCGLPNAPGQRMVQSPHHVVSRRLQMHSDVAYPTTCCTPHSLHVSTSPSQLTPLISKTRVLDLARTLICIHMLETGVAMDPSVLLCCVVWPRVGNSEGCMRHKEPKAVMRTLIDRPQPIAKSTLWQPYRGQFARRTISSDNAR